MHPKVRSEIVKYLIDHKLYLENIDIETEDAIKDIEAYIIYISKEGKQGGEIEKYASQDISINIIDYKEIVNIYLEPLYHTFIGI